MGGLSAFFVRVVVVVVVEANLLYAIEREDRCRGTRRIACRRIREVMTVCELRNEAIVRVMLVQCASRAEPFCVQIEIVESMIFWAWTIGGGLPSLFYGLLCTLP